MSATIEPPHMTATATTLGTPMPETKGRSGRRWPLILAGLIGAFLLGLAASPLVFDRTGEGAVEVANEFMADIRNENWKGAWNHVDRDCTLFRDGDLREIFGGLNLSYTLTESRIEVSSIPVFNSRFATVSGGVSSTDGPTERLMIVLEKTDGTWGVCSASIQ